MHDVERIAADLGGTPKPGGNGWMARCPTHDDRNPSLSIDIGDNDRPVLKCFAGCPQEAIIDELLLRGLWQGRNGKTLSEDEFNATRQRQLKRQAEQQRKYAEAANKAQTVWRSATAAQPDHPYLHRKQVQPTDSIREIGLPELTKLIGYHPQANGELLAEGRVLIVPVKSFGKMATVEMIDEAGRKSALAGGKKSGGFWATGKLPSGDGAGLRLLIGEGVATVLSAREPIGYPAVAVLSCGNFLLVSRQMRGEYPKAEIVILADVDKQTSEPNRMAVEAAKEIGAILAAPDFGHNRPEGMTDFNDMMVLKGRDEVRRQIEGGSVLSVESVNTLHNLPGKAVRPFNLNDFLSLEFPPRENLIAPWLPSQGLAMVYAARGIGKTHFALGVAYAVASGGSFLGWQAPNPAGVLYLDGEMPGVVMQERLGSIVLSNDKEQTAPFILLTPDVQPEGMPRIDTEEGQRQIESILTEDIRLIVVDNISTLARAKENEADGWTPIQAWALRQRAMGRSVLFVHHSGKGGQQRGTSRREDVLDTVIALKRPLDYQPDQGAVFEIHFEKARGIYGDDVKSIEARLMTDNVGHMIWSTRTVENGTFDKVVQLLNEGLKQSEIAAELQLHKSNVSRHAKRASSEGLVKAPPGGI